MDSVFETDHPQLTILSRKFGPVSTDLLRILAWCPTEGSPGYYVKDDPTDAYFKCSESEKVRWEISRWINAFKGVLMDPIEDHPLHALSPALDTVFSSESTKDARRLVTRTLRMLWFFESILLGEGGSPSNPYHGALKVPNFPDLESRIRQLADKALSPNRKKDAIAESPQGFWIVSLPLLLIVAIAECQCEYLQPFAWEAYSAGRARDELRRRWIGLDEKFQNTIGLFIRCQSAVGQYVRGSGNFNYLRLIHDECLPLAFDRQRLFAGLQMLAVVEEARNRALPVSSGTAFDANAGAEQPWGDDGQFRDIVGYLNFDPVAYISLPTREGIGGYTWSYFSPRFLATNDAPACTRADIDAFKTTILNENSALANDRYYEVISIGRTQTQLPLKALMNASIAGWNSLGSQEASTRFRRLFRLQTLAVPHPFSARDKEYILQVLLRDDLAAVRLLFPSSTSLDELLEEAANQSSLIRTPGDLFEYLVNVAAKQLSLRDDAMWQEKGTDHFPPLAEPIYFPFPLARRITAVIHRLQPSGCLNVPINFDRCTTEWVHLPYGIKKTNHLHVRILANFLLASVLNRAMAAGLQRADVDLENLAIPAMFRGPTQAPDQVEELMQPEDWRLAVQRLYEDGGYNLLLDRYIRDYNSQCKNVHFEALLLPTPQFGNELDSLAVGEVALDLAQYLSSGALGSSDPGKHDFWLLGADIGGTLTKCQLFAYSSRQQRFEPISKVFRMSTPEPASAESPKLQSGSDGVKSATDRYATRLVKHIKEREGELFNKIDHSRLVVGLSWPGPVKENRPHGTSGILKVFGLSSFVPENRIDDIWQVDLVAAVAKAWRAEFGRPSPYVSLLNDGDADAVGAIVLSEKYMTGDGLRARSDLALSVVKLGTGLAGAILRGSPAGLSLVPGLYEWGKIVLDLAAPPRRNFPQGIAREYLSKDVLPRQGRRRGAAATIFQLDEPESAEIGLILETAQGDRVSSYRALRAESGCVLGHKRTLFGISVSAEVLRVVYKDPNSDPNLLFEVRLALGAFGNVQNRLVEILDEFGRTRLERIIGYAPSRPTPPNDAAEADDLCQHPRFIQASQIAAGCAVSLGRYLGDFCAQLHDELAVTEVLLTGGVLSGETGKVATSEAGRRVEAYGLSLWATNTPGAFGIGSATERILNMQTKERGPQTAEHLDTVGIERGALGAACFAAASFIQDKKQKGLQKLRSLLLELAAGELVEVKGPRVVISDRDSGIDFREHALSEQDLQRFLEARGADWDFFQTDGPAAFVRWK